MGLTRDKLGNVGLNRTVAKEASSTAAEAIKAAAGLQLFSRIKSELATGNASESWLGSKVAGVTGMLPQEYKPKMAKANAALLNLRSQALAYIPDERLKGNPQLRESQQVMERVFDETLSNKERMDNADQVVRWMKYNVDRHNESFDAYNMPTKQHLRAAGLGRVTPPASGAHEQPAQGASGSNTNTSPDTISRGATSSGAYQQPGAASGTIKRPGAGKKPLADFGN